MTRTNPSYITGSYQGVSAAGKIINLSRHNSKNLFNFDLEITIMDSVHDSVSSGKPIVPRKMHIAGSQCAQGKEGICFYCALSLNINSQKLFGHQAAKRE
jgi:hypothetical protein